MNLRTILYSFVSISVLTAVLQAAQPVITHFSWGKVIVKNPNGKEVTYKDCIVFPAGSMAWDWRATGTQHVPGIQPADLKTKIDAHNELIYSVDVIILSRGVDLVLQTSVATISFLERMGKEYHMLQSEEAVKKYNELAGQGIKVGILLHSTC